MTVALASSLEGCPCIHSAGALRVFSVTGSSALLRGARWPDGWLSAVIPDECEMDPSLPGPPQQAGPGAWLRFQVEGRQQVLPRR